MHLAALAELNLGQSRVTSNLVPTDLMTMKSIVPLLSTMNRPAFLAAFVTTCLISSGLRASDAVLTVKVGEIQKSFSRSSLLKSPLLKTLKVENDPAYANRPRSYRAVPASEIFKDLPVDRDGTMLFKCLDGFSAPISASRLLNTDPDGSRAFIAIEPEGPADERWPALKKEDPSKTAGPFYLIWENPEKSKIVTEEWPFQLSGFENQPSIEKQYPHVAPDTNLPRDSKVRKGFKVFAQNCFGCHTINAEGASRVGPDLNIPFNPTEYFQTGFIEKLVRNPQKLRHWPQGKMRSFNKTDLSDADLENTIEYLKYMSKRKIKLEP
jgi:mono/diheme cytochrome c family protein